MSVAARRLILLGSTGSIGRSTLAVVHHLRSQGRVLEIVGLAAGANADELFAQAEQFGVRDLALAGLDGDVSAMHARPAHARIERGPDAARRLVERIAQPGDIVVGAMVGAAGLPPTLAAIERGCDIALANKETLVA